ncbi:hypothetical protein NPIL_72511 [Nephila pilipes]|uniref:DUF5641 domain-containing protein n=1 Tax=Nephila pilipes TaxID=299642 RepID=A0A8X6PTP7_NEPPI|nr:hypothetical protein NPIL_72511 [Nephila pilipes]
MVKLHSMKSIVTKYGSRRDLKPVSVPVTGSRDHKHMLLVEKDDNLISNDRIYYLYHHAVVKPSCTFTKLRVVFEVSGKVAAHPRKWKIFVVNRRSEILDVIPHEQWSHVSSKDNSADLASRGVNPENLTNSTLWCHGTSVLCMSKNHWSQQNQIDFKVDEKALSELKPKSPFNATTRYKWKKGSINLSVGDIVLIKENNVPPSVRPLGSIYDHTGNDSIVRNVTVKTANACLKRPIVKLSALPLYQE